MLDFLSLFETRIVRFREHLCHVMFCWLCFLSTFEHKFATFFHCQWSWVLAAVWEHRWDWELWRNLSVFASACDFSCSCHSIKASFLTFKLWGLGHSLPVSEWRQRFSRPSSGLSKSFLPRWQLVSSQGVEGFLLCWKMLKVAFAGHIRIDSLIRAYEAGCLLQNNGPKPFGSCGYELLRILSLEFSLRTRTESICLRAPRTRNFLWSKMFKEQGLREFTWQLDRSNLYFVQALCISRISLGAYQPMTLCWPKMVTEQTFSSILQSFFARTAYFPRCTTPTVFPTLPDHAGRVEAGKFLCQHAKVVKNFLEAQRTASKRTKGKLDESVQKLGILEWVTNISH